MDTEIKLKVIIAQIPSTKTKRCNIEFELRKYTYGTCRKLVLDNKETGRHFF
jgi:hypothetical protein